MNGYTNKNTHELKAGDVVFHYGARMLITGEEYGRDEDKHGLCIAHKARVIDRGETTPKSWFAYEGEHAYWNIQGNGRATWAVENGGAGHE
jgi:hypothetical protein